RAPTFIFAVASLDFIISMGGDDSLSSPYTLMKRTSSGDCGFSIAQRIEILKIYRKKISKK
nr:hypothetical protein [Candidatus Kapabacteria bacterium]